MNILLDTNLIIFAMYKPETLNSEAIEWLNNTQHTFFYSVLSLWEIEIKHNKNPNVMPLTAQMVEKLCIQCGMKKLNLCSKHIYNLKSLVLPDNAPRHKDPFDKMLLCQANIDNLTFLTHDSKLPNYGLDCVVYV